MLLSVVIPIFNEAAALPLLLPRLRVALRDHIWEVVFINDGSTDRTPAILDAAARNDGRIKVLHFTRNFGHQAAVTAGLDFATGDAVVVMDADLQDPPELLPRMLELLNQGYDVVSPQRKSRASETVFKRWSAAIFYRILSQIAGHRFTHDVGDFRLFSRRAVDAIRALREQHRYMRGLVAWLGMREAILPFERQARAAGKTNYSLIKMMRFAWTGISSFSALPLRISIALGCFLSCAGFVYLLCVLYLAIWTRTLIPGWASVVALQCVFSGMILLALGAVGDYVARTYEESKDRPLYVLTKTCNVAPELKQPARAVVLAESRPLYAASIRGKAVPHSIPEDEPSFNSVAV
jgi:dolichol-phosphate mannosyltransferase